MLFKILLLSIGAFSTSWAATSFSGLTIKNYIFYLCAQAITIALFLHANKDMSPLTYSLSVGGLVSFFCTLIVWARGTMPSPYAILGAIMIIVGTYLTFK